MRCSAARVVAEVLPGRDADRLPQRRRREPVDRQPRPADARSGDRTGLRNVGAVSVVDDRAPDGSLFVGTGNEGKVFRIDPQGKGSLFFDSAELEVHALALGARTAGSTSARRPTAASTRSTRTARRRRSSTPTTSTSGRWPSTPTATCSPPPATRASSTRSRPTARAARSTRPTPRTSRRSPSTRPATCWSAPARPARCCAIDPDGKAFVLLDSPFQEIRALRFDDKGTLYVAAISGRAAAAVGAGQHRRGATAPTAPSRPRAGAVGVGGNHSMSIVDVRRRPSAGSTREDRRSPKGAVYRIAPDGVWDQLWESRDDSPYDLTFDQSGALIVGTGNKGKLYRLEGDPLRPTLARARAGAAGHGVPSRTRAAGSTTPPRIPARSSACRRTRAPRGTYESEPRDAQMVSTWGAISWRGTAAGGQQNRAVHAQRQHRNARRHLERVVLGLRQRRRFADHQPEGALPAVARGADRQRRRPDPDIGDRGVSAAQSAAGGPKRSPCIRRASCSRSRSRPAIRSSPASTISRRPSASSPRRPRAQSPGSSSSLGRRTYQKGLQTLHWKADDENDDDLVYDVLYRREGETAWKTLRKAISETILVWDTTTIPNGTYFVKIVARDAPSNPLSTALNGELDSSAFEVDNTPPTIAVGERPRRSPAAPSSPSTSRTITRRSARRVLAGRPALARRVSGRRHRRFARGALRAAGRGRARRSRADASRQRRDEQRGHPRVEPRRDETAGTAESALRCRSRRRPWNCLCERAATPQGPGRVTSRKPTLHGRSADRCTDNCTGSSPVAGIDRRILDRATSTQVSCRPRRRDGSARNAWGPGGLRAFVLAGQADVERRRLLAGADRGLLEQPDRGRQTRGERRIEARPRAPRRAVLRSPARSSDAAWRCRRVARSFSRSARRPWRVTHRFEREDRFLLVPFVRALRSARPSAPGSPTVGDVVARIALERRREHGDHGGQRVGALGGGEAHHAEHDHDADGRGRRGAEPGVDQMHVVEHHAQPRRASRHLAPP